MFTTPIIAPVSADLIRQELTPDKLLRATNKGGNEIYVFHASTAPETMREIGRLREEAFRFYGGGTGRDCDVDEFDLADDGYRQLIVWDPAEGAILGGYRFMFGDEVQIDEATGRPRLATAELFEFSPRFLADYLPVTIELGRSFVSLPYQSTRMGAKSLFALDNLWDGLGALTVLNPAMKYFYGKVTMFTEALVLQAISRPEQNPIDDVAALADTAADLQDRTIARVTAAGELNEGQQAVLAEKLGKIYGRAMSIHSEVDTSLLGGMRIRVGDEVIDGSTAGKIARLRAQMA